MSDQEIMHKAMRIADMLWRFDKGQRMTRDEICERYGVSKRTVQRDIAAIERWVMPIDVERSYAVSERGEQRYGMWRPE